MTFLWKNQSYCNFIQFCSYKPHQDCDPKENRKPDAVDDKSNTNEDTSVIIKVLLNDTDPDGNSLSVKSTTPPSHGSIVVNADNTITYKPAPNYNGNDSFTYTISDGKGGTDTATVRVCVNPVNDAPDAKDDKASTNEDTPITITPATLLVNDSDPDGDTLTITSVQNPTHGTVAIVAGNVVFTPEANFNGNATFTYTISDGHGGSDTATVTICINPKNDAPDAKNDSANVDEDSSVVITVLSNDSDPDGDPLTVTGASDPAHGSVVINPNGTITYTPDANFHGNDTFTYTISDGNGGTDTATVVVCVKDMPEPNRAPDAKNDSANVDEDSSVVITVLSNDSDPDGDPLTVTAVSNPPHGSAVINPNGTITYTPDANFHGNDTFTYTISDGNGGTDTATVVVCVKDMPEPNRGPDAVNDSANVDEDSSVVITVLSNDSDPDGDPLTVTAVSNPPHGSAVINPNGTITYTPDANFHGNDTFTYTISDGNGGTDTATVVVCVKDMPEPNRAPDAKNDSANVDEDSSVVITVLSNDSDPDGDPLTVTAVSNPPHGSAVINPNGTITYTPDANFHGNDTFTYTISDGNGGTDTATVVVCVKDMPEPNRGPDAKNDSANVDEDSSVVITVLSNDSDPDGDPLTITAVSNPPHGSAVINPNGTITYTPDANFHGNDTFTYTISDGNGGTDTATVVVCVKDMPEPNRAPDAKNDSANVDEDSSVVITVLSNDSDPDGDPLTITAVSNPPHGSAVINPNGTITYTPDANFHGNDTFTYTISDGNGGTDTATVVVCVKDMPEPNRAPDAKNDSANVDEDSSVVITVLSNDSDPDGDPLTVTGASDPAHGSVVINPNGTITYTPDANFHGNDTFTYTISDGNGGTDTATVVVCVKDMPEPNRAPDAKNDSANVDEDSSVVITVLSNDSDPDGDPLTVTAVSNPPHGSAVINPNGTITYTPDANFHGNDTFTYTISDGNGGTDTATVVVCVASKNDKPDAVDDNASTNQGVPVNINVLVNDSDPDGDPLHLVSFTQGSNGTVTRDDNGTPGNNSDDKLIYTPAPGFSGNDTFTYTIDDGHGGTDTATVHVVVAPPENRPPVATNDIATTDEGVAVNINVMSNDSDPDGDTLAITAVTQGAHGAVTINNNGTPGNTADDFVVYTPVDGFVGFDSFTYTISDGHGGTDTATVNVDTNKFYDLHAQNGVNEHFQGKDANEVGEAPIRVINGLLPTHVSSLDFGTIFNLSNNPGALYSVNFFLNSVYNSGAGMATFVDIVPANNSKINFTLDGVPFVVTLGTDVNNILTGDGGQDLMYGFQGNDSITSGANDDIVYGDDKAQNYLGGIDIISTSSGNDVIFGDAFQFVAGGAGGADVIDAGAGDDVIWGDARFYDGGGNSGANDIINAGDGRDLVYGDAAVLRLGDTAGSDDVQGGAGIDDIYGDSWMMVGGTGAADILKGGDDQDFIYGDAKWMNTGSHGANDSLNGNAGDDYVYGDGEQLIDNSVGGNDNIVGEAGNDRLYGDAGGIYNEPAHTLIEAGMRDSTGGQDNLYGGAGNDFIFGDAEIAQQTSPGALHAGNDFIEGGAGNDQMWGDFKMVLNAAEADITAAYQGGSDTFFFDTQGTGASFLNLGNDIIHDFSVAEGDVLQFDDILNLASLKSVSSVSGNANGDIVLSISGGTNITFTDVHFVSGATEIDSYIDSAHINFSNLS